MKWFKKGTSYCSIMYVVWPKDADARCKYIIQRVMEGKGIAWYLWQWNDAAGAYAQVPNVPERSGFDRLFHAQERADWLERKDARAGAKPAPSPVDAALAAFEAQQQA